MVAALALTVGIAFAAAPEGALAAPAFSRAMAKLPEPAAPPGGCTAPYQTAFTDGDGHDHLSQAAHSLVCSLDHAATLDLVAETADMPSAVLGDMDRVGDTLVVTVMYPEAGLLIFDVADPLAPKLRRLHRTGVICNNAEDVNCATTVSLSDDGKTAWLGLQFDGPRPNDGGRSVGAVPALYPALERVDVHTGASEQHAIWSFGGVSAIQAFTVPASANGDRDPGDWLAYALTGRGIFLQSEAMPSSVTQLEGYRAEETSGLEIAQDPLTGRTLLFALHGFDTVFTVWDVSQPRSPRILGEWDPTPECEFDWYARSIDVRVVGGRRIAAVALAGYDDIGTQSEDDQRQGCGVESGNGDLASPVMLVDITDFARLGTGDPDQTEEEEETSDMKKRSEAVYVTAWANPTGQPAANGRFATSNVHFVDDQRLLVAAGHAGAVLLDVTEAMAGRNVRPHELAAAVTAPGAPRPVAAGRPSGFAERLGPRPLTLDALPGPSDAVWSADASGGLTAWRIMPSRPARSVDLPDMLSPCEDVTAPRAKLRAVKLRRSSVFVSGTARDKGCSAPGAKQKGAVRRVRVSVARRVSKNTCVFLHASGAQSGKRPCAKPEYIAARGTTRWAVKLEPKDGLKPGSYMVLAQASDRAGNDGKIAKTVRVR